MTAQNKAKTAPQSVKFLGREALAYLRGHERAMVRLLGEFVRCESFSYEKKAVDAVRKLPSGGGAGGGGLVDQGHCLAPVNELSDRLLFLLREIRRDGIKPGVSSRRSSPFRLA